MFFSDNSLHQIKKNNAATRFAIIRIVRGRVVWAGHVLHKEEGQLFRITGRFVLARSVAPGKQDGVNCFWLATLFAI